MGICYGLQLLCKEFNGQIGKSNSREYGHSLIDLKKKSILYKNIKDLGQVWMSHGDHIEKLQKILKLLSFKKYYRVY